MQTNIIPAEIPAPSLNQIKIAAMIASDLSKGVHPEDELLSKVEFNTLQIIIDDIQNIQNA